MLSYSKTMLSIFSFRSYIVFTIIFRFMTQIELILCMVWERGKSPFCVCVCGYPFDGNTILSRQSLRGPFVAVKWLSVCGYVPELSILFLSFILLYANRPLLWKILTRSLQEHKLRYLFQIYGFHISVHVGVCVVRLGIVKSWNNFRVHH